MAKNRIEFLCRECGSNHVKWLGKCPDCGAWDSLDKFAVEAESAKSASAPIWGVAPDGAEAEDLARSGIGRAVALGSVPEASVPRLPTGISELDRVLGGGIVPGSVMLLGGDPGIGKSTLIMQAAASIAARGGVALYASSEESPQQVRLRAERLQAVISAGGSKALGERMLVMGETNVARIIEQARRSRASLVLVDSIQLVHRADVSAAPGCSFVATMAGTRCLLGEINALVATGFLGSAKRRVSGLDSGRLAMLIAVLEKHGGLRLADQDVFAQSLGGIKIAEPAADLAVLLAIAGAFLHRTLPHGTVAISEVGLTGELRTVPHIEQRVHESLRRGARTVLIPASARINDDAIASVASGASIVKLGTIQRALELLIPTQRSFSVETKRDASVEASTSKRSVATRQS